MYTFRFIFPVLLGLFILTSIGKPAQAGIAKKAAGTALVATALVALIKGKELYKKCKEQYKANQLWFRREYALKLAAAENLKKLSEDQHQQYNHNPAKNQLEKELDWFRKRYFIYRLF